MSNIFLSGPFDYKGKGWGYAHYSYGFAMDSFHQVVRQNENIVGKFAYPFNLSAIKRSLSFMQSKNPVGFSFLPPDVSLLVPGFRNICVFAWEFDKLPTKSKERNGIFKKDYASELKKYDSVITLSAYSQKTLSSYGINSHVLPSAVSQKSVDAGEDISNLKCYNLSTTTGSYRSDLSVPLSDIFDGSTYENRFLYILNPHDIRKNFGNLVTAFVKFRKTNPDAVLILKMTAKGELAKLQETAFRREFPSFPETSFENVYFIPERLSDSKLQMLMNSCQNYVSPSRAEGQNLPLCEAMLSGMLCIAPDHTSMGDYVTKDSAIVLESSPWIIDETTHTYSEFWGLSWYNVGERAILDALHKATSLTKEDKAAMIVKAKKNVSDFCSPEAVLEKWQQIKLQLNLD
jgi:glycosyltransferase involved in cell wall biosynthesis